MAISKPLPFLFLSYPNMEITSSSVTFLCCKRLYANIASIKYQVRFVKQYTTSDLNKHSPNNLPKGRRYVLRQIGGGHGCHCPSVTDAYTRPAERVSACILYLSLYFRLSDMPVAVSSTPTPSGGLKAYYQAKIEAAEIEINQKTQNLRRLEAQRNALNARGMFGNYSRIV